MPVILVDLLVDRRGDLLAGEQSGHSWRQVAGSGGGSIPWKTGYVPAAAAGPLVAHVLPRMTEDSTEQGFFCSSVRMGWHRADTLKASARLSMSQRSLRVGKEKRFGVSTKANVIDK